KRELDRARIPDAALLAAYWAAPLDSLQSRAGHAPANRDDRPVVEYRAPRDLIAVGHAQIAGAAGAAARLPFTAVEPAGPLFSAWTPVQWYEARTRWLLEQGDSARAARTARAARDAAPATAPALDSLVASAARRARSRDAYADA